jgi:polar amino acid transport system substrate-binding protein
MKFNHVLCLILSLLFVAAPFAQGKEVQLSTLEWPPYSGAQLVEQGLSAYIAKEAFKAVDYNATVEFFPWMRAVNLAKDGTKFSGYFPEYYNEAAESDFYFSDPIGIGPLGFVERKDSHVAWNALSDLKNETIGTVRGYTNTVEFDAMVASGELKADVSNDDLTNLKKVLNGRIKLAVIDKLVMEYLIDGNADLKIKKDELQFNSKLLEEKKLYICFAKNAEGKKMQEVFNRGLKLIDIDELTKEYFSK